MDLVDPNNSPTAIRINQIYRTDNEKLLLFFTSLFTVMKTFWQISVKTHELFHQYCPVRFPADASTVAG
jgi:hypothetical protein